MSDVLGTEPVIRTPDRRLRVFVSSSLVELADERRAVSRAISALRLTPVMFEQGARPHPPRDVYRAYLAQSDVFVGLCWQRYGQPPADADAIRHRRSTGALEELRSQSEPLWTALAAGSLAWQEASAGRIDDALRYLQEVRDLGDQLDSAWLAAWSRECMGTLAIARGELDQARMMLADLALSVEAHSTDSVTRCLIAFARLAFAGGDAEPAALLVGAAEGLRRRVGLRAWPILRNGEADLSGQISRALGANRFSESRQEAVAAVSRQNGVDMVSPTSAGYAEGMRRDAANTVASVRTGRTCAS